LGQVGTRRPHGHDLESDPSLVGSLGRETQVGTDGADEQPSRDERVCGALGVVTAEEVEHHVDGARSINRRLPAAYRRHSGATEGRVRQFGTGERRGLHSTPLGHCGPETSAVESIQAPIAESGAQVTSLLSHEAPAHRASPP